MKNPKRLLIFYPSNKRSVVLETISQLYTSKGIHLIFLTMAEEGDLHIELENMGVQHVSRVIHGKGFFRLIRYLLFLIKFCHQNQIDIVHSHLQDANLISVFFQFFFHGKTIIFRHHFVYPGKREIKRNRNQRIGEKIITRLARKIIVPSRIGYDQIVQNEKINPGKIDVIPYIYDFKKYAIPDENHVHEIQFRYPASLRLLLCSRHIREKRHILAFKVVKGLIETGLDIVLFVLDEGPEKKTLEHFVRSTHLESRIIFTGFRKDFIDFMASSDLLVHPSLTEASNSSVKEMGILKRTVAVCKGVGDFDEYIQDRINGFVINTEEPYESLKNIITYSYQNKHVLQTMGNNLKLSVENRFGMNETLIKKYMQYV